jgi:hypothetical protein
MFIAGGFFKPPAISRARATSRRVRARSAPVRLPAGWGERALVFARHRSPPGAAHSSRIDPSAFTRAGSSGSSARQRGMSSSAATLVSSRKASASALA